MVPQHGYARRGRGVADRFYLLAQDRGVLAVSGPDARVFLQGLVSNDVRRVAPDRAIYAAFLTPQGRYLHDFFIAEIAGELHLDCEASRRADLLRRLSLYRLRSKVALSDSTDSLAVALLYGEGAGASFSLPADPGRAAPMAAGTGIVYVDPRLPDLGLRTILPREEQEAVLRSAGFRPGDREDYDRLRISLGVPDGSRDLPVERAILLENGFDELHGIDWQKGCYMGQELTARTRYRGLVRKRLLPVVIEGPPPSSGEPVFFDGQEAGEMRSAVEGIGLALIRLEFLGREGSFRAGKARLLPRKPRWAAF